MLPGQVWKKALKTQYMTEHWPLQHTWKVGQSSHSDFVYLGKVSQNSKGSVRSQ